MDYVLVVKGPIYGSQSAFLAYQFAQVLVQKHKLCQIFFYQDGVTNGNKLVYPANDEFNLVKAWQDFSIENDIPLYLCIAAAQRRGIVDDSSAAEKSAVNLADVFELVGLTELNKALFVADRVITL